MRLQRADEETAADAAGRFVAFFLADGRRHFAQEEELLLPELGAHPEHVERVLADHETIREAAADLRHERHPAPDRLHTVGACLHDHVRYEERVLFPLLEADLSEERLAQIGARLAADG